MARPELTDDERAVFWLVLRFGPATGRVLHTAARVFADTEGDEGIRPPIGDLADVDIALALVSLYERELIDVVRSETERDRWVAVAR